VKKSDLTSFYQLDPEVVLQATEEAGFRPTGEFSQLNSYENRVFDLRLDGDETAFGRVIAKFYRPGRWNADALNEEHQFLFELKKEGIPVVAPLLLSGNKSFLSVQGMNVAFFPKFVGKMPEELLEKDLYQIGRRLAQIHNVGSRKNFSHRPVVLDSPYSAWENLDFLAPKIAPEVFQRYETAAIEIIERLEQDLDPEAFIRIHGDCHRGNLLFQRPPGGEREFFFVDFDDCMMGPEVQDFWMLFAEADSDLEKDLILSGYEELREFPEAQWQWAPLLRGLRILNYAAWIARRWEDPSFPKLFPEFGSYSYWAEETEALERIAWSFARR
jgi:Ser/Thr protein kinase RdoA (MazF antagonist)